MHRIGHANPDVESAAGIISKALAAGRLALTEVEAKDFLRCYNIPVPQGFVATQAGEAVAAATHLGFPVVLKGVSTSVLHKTEAGLVELDVRDEDEVERGFHRLLRRGGEQISGVLVEQQAARGREFVIGLTRDAQFGPVIMFGVGGVLTEAIDDVAFAVAPVDRRDALELVSSIRAHRLLGEFRGWPAADRHVLASVIEAVGRMAFDHPEIAEIDINPVLIDGGRPVAADALLVLRPDLGSPLVRPEVNLVNMMAVFRPASVAVIGASNDPTKWGGTILTNLVSGGYGGRLYPVTPQVETVLGLHAYPDVTSLPEAPEMALVAVPLPLVKGVVEECGRKGVKALVMVTAGFSEVDEAGSALEREIAQIASDYGMVLIGPNCMGVVSSRHRLYAVGALHLQPKPGPAGFISQSGNVGVQLMVSAERRGAGVGTFIGVGNEALVDTADVLDFLREDPDTGCVFAYIEGYDDGRRLLESARALTEQKPLVVLRAAVSDYGREAAASHTGALAGSQRVFEGAARQAGMLLTIDPDEFLDMAMAFSYLPLPRGNRVGVVTMGGGWGVLCADEVARSGLTLARFDDELLHTLDALLPSFWSRGNPVDLVATLKEGVAEAVVEAIMASPQVDILVVSGVVSVFGLTEGILAQAKRLHEQGVINLAEVDAVEPGVYARRREHFIRHLVDLMERYRKPILSVAAVPVGRSVFPDWGDFGVVVIQSPVRAVRVAAQMARYAERRRRLQTGLG